MQAGWARSASLTGHCSEAARRRAAGSAAHAFLSLQLLRGWAQSPSRLLPPAAPLPQAHELIVIFQLCVCPSPENCHHQCLLSVLLSSAPVVARPFRSLSKHLSVFSGRVEKEVFSVSLLLLELSSKRENAGLMQSGRHTHPSLWSLGRCSESFGGRHLLLSLPSMHGPEGEFPQGGDRLH